MWIINSAFRWGKEHLLESIMFKWKRSKCLSLVIFHSSHAPHGGNLAASESRRLTQLMISNIRINPKVDISSETVMTEIGNSKCNVTN